MVGVVFVEQVDHGLHELQVLLHLEEYMLSFCLGAAFSCREIAETLVVAAPLHFLPGLYKSQRCLIG